jgi:ABC-type phosphate/phosphonate transport system substrate-binding protein
MRRRVVPVVAVVLAGSLILAGCSKSSSSASGAPSVSVSVPALPTTEPSTSLPGSNPTSDFCTALKTEQAKLKALNTSFAGSIASTDIATIKKNLTDYMAAVTQAAARVETTMTSAPADVQAALQVFNAFLTELPAKIKGATSLPSLAAVFKGMDTAQMKAAAKTLSDYGKSQCGG